MKENERDRFAVLIVGAWETYGKVPTKAAMEVFWSCLKKYSLSDVEMAIYRHLQDPEDGRFPPLVAHINRWLNRGRSPLVAWAEVEDAMVRHGAYKTVEFQDQVTNAVIHDLGGWPAVCREHIQEPWTQKEFERRYAEYADAGRKLEGALPGIHEIENRAAGYLKHIPDPIYIQSGDAKQISSTDQRKLNK